MATRTWSSAASTDMNDTGNYSGAGSFATDDLVFDATSVINAAATAGITCNSITVTSGYTGTWSLSGQTATCAQGFSDDGITGAHNYGNGITCNGASATFHVGSGVGTITATSCALTMNGTTAMVIDDDKGIFLKTLTLGASAVVTNSGAQPLNISHTATPLIFTNGGTLTVNQQISLNVGGSVDAYSIGGAPTINGNSILNVRSNAAALTIGLPAITTTGTTTLNIRHGSAYTAIFSQSGTISAPTVQILTASTGTTTFTTNDNAITATTSLSFGANNAGSTFTLNAGASAFTVAAVNSTSYNTGTAININMSTSTWTVTGNWTFGSNFTVSEGTSSVTFSGTGATNTVTSAGKSFYDVTINKTATGGVTFADAASLHALTISGTNTQTATFTTMTATGDITIDGSSAITLANTITMSGASATFHLGSTLGTVTLSSVALVMNGTTGMTLDIDKASLFFGKLTLGNSAVVTSTGSATLGVNQNVANTLTLGNNSTFTCNNTIDIRLTTAGSILSIGTGVTFNGSGDIYVRINAASVAQTLPALTYTGTGDWYITESGVRTGSSLTFNGAINIGSNDLIFGSTTSGTSLTYALNGQTFTCAALKFGAALGATDAVTLGAATISCTSFAATSTAGTTSINMGSAAISCSGAFTFGSTHTISEGTSSVTFSGTGATNTVTSNGKKFYDVTINKTATAGVTFADAASLHSLTASGTNTQAISWTGTTMTASGDITLDGTGTHIFGNGVTLTGASSNFHIGSTLTAPTATSCVLTFSGAACVFDDDKGSSIKNLVTGAAGGVSFTGSANTTFSDTASIVLGTGTSIPASFTWSATLATLVASTLVCPGSLTFAAGQTVTGTAATQSCTFTNTATITSNGKAFPGAVVFNAAGKTFTLAGALSIAGNLTITAGTLAGAFTTTCAGNVVIMVNTTFNRLILTKATTRRVTINAGSVLTLSNLTDTDVNGAAGALTEWRSFVPGVTFSLSVPAPITLQYQNPQDCVASALITATSADGGNNTNWLFPVAGAPGYMKYW